MKRSKAVKIIERVAVREGVSIVEVRRNMQEAIDIAYTNRDESTSEFWMKWRHIPTPEEFLNAANKAVLDKLNFSGLK